MEALDAPSLLARFLWAGCYLQTLEVGAVTQDDLLLYRCLVYLDGEWS